LVYSRRSFLADPGPRGVLYRAAGEWLHAFSPPTARLAYTEIGVVGYYSERPIVDLMGLVTRWTRTSMARGDLLAAAKEARADYIASFSNNNIPKIVHSDWFERNYRLAREFRADPPGEQVVRLYRLRRPDPDPPAPSSTTESSNAGPRSNGARAIGIGCGP